MIKYSKLKINMQQYSLSLLSKYNLVYFCTRFSLLFKVNLVYYSTTKKIQFSLLTKYSQVIKCSKIAIIVGRLRSSFFDVLEEVMIMTSHPIKITDFVKIG